MSDAAIITDEAVDCEGCGSSEWTVDDEGVSSGLIVCADCGYLPRAKDRDRIDIEE